MNKINQFTITGNLTKDATTSSNGKTTISIACNRIEKGKDGAQDKKHTAYVDNIEMWNADEQTKQLKKGMRVTVSGYFKPSTWTGKDGKTHNDLTLNANNITAGETQDNAE